ncbi:unnamed protein product [Camellia sinensis]
MEETNNNIINNILYKPSNINSQCSEQHQAMDELPLDIVFDIFSRIPIKSLLQSRSVSKLWCHIIDDPFLANMHLTKTIEEPIMLLLSYPTLKRKNMSFHFVRESNRTLKAIENPIAKLDINECSLEGSCHGLLSFSYNKKQCFVLFNPLRNKFLELPLPTTTLQAVPGVVSCGLGFDSSTRAYKLVRVVYQELDLKVLSRVELYSLGMSEWKEIVEVPPYPTQGKAVFAHGFLHWLVSPFFTHENSESMIVSFNIENEKFHMTPHPNFHSKDLDLFQLLDLNGNLGMVDRSCHTKIDIWVLKGWEKKEWVKEYRIDIHAPGGRSDNGHFEVKGMWEHGEILLQCEEGFFIYNPKTGLRYSQSLGLESNSTVLYSHRRSLISIPKVMTV